MDWQCQPRPLPRDDHRRDRSLPEGSFPLLELALGALIGIGIHSHRREQRTQSAIRHAMLRTPDVAVRRRNAIRLRKPQ